MQNEGTQDFSNFFGPAQQSRKQKLIAECQKNDVTIYADDQSENTSSIMRPVASEAELERRLLSKKSFINSNRSIKIAIFALIISVLALVISA